MPIPSPQRGETRAVFVGRCMANEVMRREYPKSGQRYAVCNSQWSRAKDGKAEGKQK
jgi:hypothetical protein